MSLAKQERNEWELPHLKESHQLVSTMSDFWAVKFYPYNKPGVDPVFAVAGGRHVLICRPPPVGKESKTIDVIQAIVDEEPEADNYCCTWTKDSESGAPFLCVAGANAKIKIINSLTGELQRTLAGHGGEINDLAISPINLQILASASEDSTVRIWSLEPAHTKQPCAVILAGDGHKETILTISFHANGRYLLSGGVDHIINLWTLPELPDKNTGTDKPTMVHYPHFSTSELHDGIVDCITFHGDLILSKAEHENCIVLWLISGFSSANPPPSPSSAPTTHDSQRDTRSAFSTVASSTGPPNQYMRLLQFAIPDSEIMFMRFSLFPGINGGHPVLAMCNTASKVFFWDLARLQDYFDYVSGTSQTSTSFSSDASQEAKRPAWLVPFRSRLNKKDNLSRLRETSPTESTSSHHTGSMESLSISLGDHEKSKALWESRYKMSDPLENLLPHREEVVRGLNFLGRQVAWSVGGEWCVIVGSASVIAVFQRWAK